MLVYHPTETRGGRRLFGLFRMIYSECVSSRQVNKAPVQWKDCMHLQISGSRAFSNLYTLALHSSCGRNSIAVLLNDSVKAVHVNEFSHFRLLQKKIG